MKKVITQGDWFKAMSGDRICPLCKKPVEIQHTPNLNKDGKLCHDYCLRTNSIPHDEGYYV